MCCWALGHFLTGGQQWCYAHRGPTLTPHRDFPHSHLFPTGFLENAAVTSHDSANHGNPTQKPACIPHNYLRKSRERNSLTWCCYVGPCHIEWVMNEAGVIFQLQVWVWVCASASRQYGIKQANKVILWMKQVCLTCSVDVIKWGCELNEITNN